MRALVARLDGLGGVLVSGPAVRAVAAVADEVVMLCGPRGRPAAELLPGAGHVIECSAPWIDPEPVDRADIDLLVPALRGFDRALILTASWQSPLPLALLLRMAGVPWIGAITEDRPGSLLDLRHRPDPALPEPERLLALAAAAGFPAPADTRLRIKRPLPQLGPLVGAPGHVVVHPAASESEAAWPPERCAEAVRLLAAAGHRVVVTGDRDEKDLTAYVAGDTGLDLGGRTTLPMLASVLARARALVAGNTGPAHLAAAVGTPVVSLFAAAVPAARWAPHGVPSAASADPHQVVAAVERIAGGERLAELRRAAHQKTSRPRAPLTEVNP
ncbi:glycosyltransferase family 9 protein [Spirillospora sp. CA-294931]|uniref:glycosyltransferase family 9 protein n=1 Tax=Spirillospora sp. CA-294931 TaxID=3240042 RepID=UPI003D905504